MHRLIGPGSVGADGVGPDSDSSGACADLLASPVDPADDPVHGPADACEGCAAEGVDHWAHLRRCLTCGYVGCCDSSPRKHATVHHKSTQHPVMRSAEPGESWRWCYVHAELG